MLCTGWFNCDW